MTNSQGMRSLRGKGWWALLMLIALLLAEGSAAEEFSAYPPDSVQDFLGLDDTSAPTRSQPGHAQDLQNVNLDISRSLQKRFGLSLPVTVGTDALALKDTLDIQDEAFCAVTGVAYAKFSSGTERTIATCSNRMYFLNGVASWDQVTGAAMTSGQNNQFVFATALDNLVGTNDVDAPLQYDGTTLAPVSFAGLSASSTPATAKVVAFFKNFLVLGNVVENSVERPTRIRWSNVGTINTWTDADFIDIDALSGQEINCMGELYDTLIVGMTNSLYKVAFVGGSGTFQVAKISDDVGCIAKNSMQQITLLTGQTGLLFLDKHSRVYLYNGMAPQEVSTLIHTTLDGLRDSRLPHAVSATTGTDYVLCATEGATATVNNLCLDFQYQLGEWTQHTNIPANAMASVLDTNGNPQIYLGSYKSLVYRYQDTGLTSDVGTTSPTTVTVDVVATQTTATASGLTVVYDEALSLVTGVLVGAPVKVVGGTGVGQTNTVADNTSTGLVVTDAFSTPLDATSTLEVGAIDAFYDTVWFTAGDATRRKRFGELYWWSDEDSGDDVAFSYAVDFGGTLETTSVDLSTTGAGIWGEGLWGTMLWGGAETIFHVSKLQSDGRFLRVKWVGDDPDESFRLYGWNLLYWLGRRD